jgi:hypothetical protein
MQGISTQAHFFSIIFNQDIVRSVVFLALLIHAFPYSSLATCHHFISAIMQTTLTTIDKPLYLSNWEQVVPSHNRRIARLDRWQVPPLDMSFFH